MTKFDFFVLRDGLFAISQLHTMASSLLTVNSRERKHREGSYHRQTERNSID